MKVEIPDIPPDVPPELFLTELILTLPEQCSQGCAQLEPIEGVAQRVCPLCTLRLVAQVVVAQAERDATLHMMRVGQIATRIRHLEEQSRP